MSSVVLTTVQTNMSLVSWQKSRKESESESWKCEAVLQSGHFPWTFPARYNYLWLVKHKKKHAYDINLGLVIVLGLEHS